ncbi:valine--tRNA ligase [Caldisericum exile]|uniref:Valine--tRNA ligase n=1 Tax=Caldisericum exile (strain DSM 21853 / NBRC 104410 / AZM16c01) TaxID=511051 RepID=A0A7U6GF94_CALEA|nr:valine--tRNA ligase [Caldisericum exile]BAL81338.1 valyl-tRNA synthetase [Caldisericum exile AZM16c01]
MELAKEYNHKDVEDKIYKMWEEGNYFDSEIRPEKENFVIVMPPPNVTGKLHIGHALNFTLQDIFVRFNRMFGKETLWLPGIDHAGIATQSVVERELLSKGIKKDDLGREKFLEEVWKWKEKYGNTIIEQSKKLGVSADWRRLRFTLDEKYVNSVLEAFIRYYNEGLLYRGERIINWCPRCHTALSDIEVEYEEEKGKLYYIKYPLEGSEEFITVATTRPETMLGDTAVAVHPRDERYKNLIGKYVILPLVGRRIPIIADDAVDPQFGTGAVKVTPSHSPDDFEIAKRHNLEFLDVINDVARMINVPEQYLGLTTAEARDRVVEDLKNQGYLVKVEDYIHSVGHCQRCHTVVEPLISKQWFLSMKSLAEEAKEAVKVGKVKITPEKWVKVYYDWLNNIRDWCVSRQLWWGHRIPAYYCEDCGEIIVSKEPVVKCPKCGSTHIKQDDDVLDTWFSSALWPFATLGWPEDTAELNYYYPTTLLITGYDILFFWVARMIWSGMHFMKKEPFYTVMLHGLVRDEKGRKMSKSLKNIVDPLDLIEEYGADALRFTLASLTTVGGQDINLSKEKLKASRNFVNKIWNASRFVLMNLEGFNPEEIDETNLELELEDKWFLSRLNKHLKMEIEYLKNYDLGEAARKIYEFVWGEFCDWYIELSKVRLYGDDDKKKKTAQYLLWKSLVSILKMLHPYMPFATEEIYSHIPFVEKPLIKSDFPNVNEAFINDKIEKDAEFVFGIIRGIRSLKAELGIPVGTPLNAYFNSIDENEVSLVKEENDKILKLAHLTSLEYVEKKPERVLKTVVQGSTVYMELPFDVDLQKEKERFLKKLKEIDAELKSINSRLMNPVFLEKATAEVINKDRERQKELEKTKAALLSHIEDLEG